MPTKSKEKQREYSARHYAKNRKARIRTQVERKRKNYRLLKEYLLYHPCVDCGEEDPIVLDFDHVRGKKEAHVSKAAGALGWGWERIMKEIDKCEVRCANCHRRVTHERKKHV